MEATREIVRIGETLHDLIKRLYPYCRSITGNGVRQTLSVLQEIVPLKVTEVPTGTRVFDWEVPKEWNIKSAFIRDPSGRKIVDFTDSPLHVVSYSIPVSKKVSLKELKEHLYSLPEHPDWIPYRTSYYNETWGFCIQHSKAEVLMEGSYEVNIDSTLEDGYLSYGEFYIQGSSPEEILLSTHICHPSMCNDNLSGIAVMAYLARHLSQLNLRYSYRFLFIPGTIGSITWLAMNREKISCIRHALVLVNLGDPDIVTYKKSRQGNAEIDRIVNVILRDSGQPYKLVDFYPYGYDERQYCSPGFNLPAGSIMRTPHGSFPEYHTSADDIDFVKPGSLEDSWNKINDIAAALEMNRTYRNRSPWCEPQLGKRGLYRHIGGGSTQVDQMSLLWMLNLSDGHHSILDIAERSGSNFFRLNRAAELLVNCELLELTG